MKYIRKAKNTSMSGKLPDDYVTEMVDQSVFTADHAAMSGWELVEDVLADRLMQTSMLPVVKQSSTLSEAQKLKVKQKLQAARGE